MLKHMLNGGVSMSNSERTVVKQSTINSNRNLLTTVQAQQQQQLHLPQQEQPQEYHIQFETVNAELHNCLRAPTEPEYQNTRLHSPISEFYRGVHFNKSVRSNENMCETDLQHSKRDGQWNRIRPGLSTSIPTGDTFQSTRSHGRSSVLNHSYTSTITPHPFVNHQQQRLNQTVDVLNLSSTTSPTNFMPIANGSVKMIANGGLHIPKSSPLTPVTPTSVNRVSKTDSSTDVSKDNNNNNHANENNNGDANAANDIFGNGVKEILTSLGLLCLISLLLALLSLIFLLKISPVTATDMKDLLRAEQFTIISPDEYVTVYEVTLALCALSLSLNLCCLLVCSVQFLFAVKLTRSSIKGDRTNRYLEKSAVTRVCAIAGFFISIPVFLTGVILYTFIQFHSTPAIITSILIGSGIVFCGCAMVHNVFIWQREKTNAVKAFMRKQGLHQQLETAKRSTSSKLDTVGTRETSATALSTMSTLPPHVGVDLNSVTSTPHELSTLV